MMEVKTRDDQDEDPEDNEFHDPNHIKKTKKGEERRRSLFILFPANS